MALFYECVVCGEAISAEEIASHIADEHRDLPLFEDRDATTN